VPVRQLDQVLVEQLLPVGVERVERLQRRAVVRPEVVRHVRRRRESEDEVLRRHPHVGDPVTEQLAEARGAAPLGRRPHTGRRRDAAADGLEQVTDEAVRRPVGQADGATGPDHPDQLGGGLLLVRREHHADHGEHRVELAVPVRQILRVGLLERDRQVLGLGAGPAAVHQVRHVIHGHDLAEAARGGDGRVAGAGGHVEHAGPGGQIGGLDQCLGHRMDQGRDRAVVAAFPGLLLLCLDAFEGK
jgi:hypothetical protein